MSASMAKRILVTGAAGFIGAFLCKNLIGKDGCSVIGLDNLNDYYDADLKLERLQMIRQTAANSALSPQIAQSDYETKQETVREKHGDRFTFIRGDICDMALLDRVFGEYQPEIVVNLAAQAGVRYSIDHPREYIDSNIVGFFNILEQCRAHAVSHLIFASSSSVYGDTSETPFSESGPCNQPVSLYAATKKSDEMLAYSYASLFDLPCTGLRFFSVYGPMGRPDMAYFQFAERMVAGKPVRLFNNGQMLRDFTYIDDIVEGVGRVIDGPLPTITPSERNTAPYRIFNIGHGNPVPLLEFVEALESALQAEGVLQGETEYEYLPMQAGDVHRTYADMSEFQREYGYTAQTSLQEGLSQFAKWFAQRKRSQEAEAIGSMCHYAN